MREGKATGHCFYTLTGSPLLGAVGALKLDGLELEFLMGFGMSSTICVTRRKGVQASNAMFGLERREAKCSAIPFVWLL